MTDLGPEIARARRQTLADLPRRSARRHPHKLAIVCGDGAQATRWTFADFDAVVVFA